MSEACIKLVSDPYARRVEYFRWDNAWKPIDLASSPNSKLLKTELVTGFFPFKAQDIVDAIIAEYQTGSQPVRLVFEGSDDEFEELQLICTDVDHATKISLERGSRYLSNARDVLPEIIQVFKDIQPLVDEGVLERKKVSREIEKFTDVSSDVIPLCVLGNYSAGKSTFINALIGHELLPNGDEPVTAKVFEIKRSKQRDRATISFTRGEVRYLLRFGEEGLVPSKELAGDEFYERVARATSRCDASMVAHMNAALKTVNADRLLSEAVCVSDLVKIEIPFSESDQWASDREFVIFDTPGSNSASNDDHIRVLREAMEGLSNGLPIFVAERTSLDTRDNEALYTEIEQIDAMDERFAMIVVNKADSADLPKGGFDEDEIQAIMDEAIPRKMFAQGIYFVSSILGLGAKNKGDFASDNYAEKFEDQERKYTNPDSRFYKTLYRYNILPGQISQRTNRESEACQDLLLANSGLYCVESEISRFADRYSAYNKCHQSELLLNRIIDVTAEEIGAAKEAREEERAKREQELEDDKARLVEEIEALASSVQTDAVAAYSQSVESQFVPDFWKVSIESLLGRQEDITAEKRKLNGYALRSEDARKAWSSIATNFAESISKVAKSGDAEAVKSAFARLADDAKEAQSKQKAARDASKDADAAAADDLLEEVRAQFDAASNDIYVRIDTASRTYWEQRAEAGRNALYQLATNSEVLSEEKRKEVGAIIIQYPGLVLTKNATTIFNKAELIWELRIDDLVLFKTDKLALTKLSAMYNREIGKRFEDERSSIRFSHEQGFRNWLSQLLKEILENITDYNPVLHGHVQSINEATDKINDLTNKRNQLKQCSAHVSHVIGWKE